MKTYKVELETGESVYCVANSQHEANKKANAKSKLADKTKAVNNGEVIKK